MLDFALYELLYFTVVNEKQYNHYSLLIINFSLSL
jgi:hypothetical protein